MTYGSGVHIAGVGISPSPAQVTSAKTTVVSVISAVTKALLDAGITYDDVDLYVKTFTKPISNIELEALKSFSNEKTPGVEVEKGKELQSAYFWINQNDGQCLLMVDVDESAAVALILVSDDFLSSRSYLKDSAVLMRDKDTTQSESGTHSIDELYRICQRVWTLRGWSHQPSVSQKDQVSPSTSRSNQSYELSRSDNKPVPKWEEVEHKQDGKHRLRYNPATKTCEISYEDYESVCAIGKRHDGTGGPAYFKRQGGDRAALARL